MSSSSAKNARVRLELQRVEANKRKLRDAAGELPTQRDNELGGVLRKKSRYGFWQKRYFATKGQYLRYYRSVTDAELRSESSMRKEINLLTFCDIYTRSAEVHLKGLGAYGASLVLRTVTLGQADAWAKFLAARCTEITVQMQNDDTFLSPGGPPAEAPAAAASPGRPRERQEVKEEARKADGPSTALSKAFLDEAMGMFSDDAAGGAKSRGGPKTTGIDFGDEAKPPPSVTPGAAQSSDLQVPTEGVDDVSESEDEDEARDARERLRNFSYPSYGPVAEAAAPPPPEDSAGDDVARAAHEAQEEEEEEEEQAGRRDQKADKETVSQQSEGESGPPEAVAEGQAAPEVAGPVESADDDGDDDQAREEQDERGPAEVPEEQAGEEDAPRGTEETAGAKDDEEETAAAKDEVQQEQGTTRDPASDDAEYVIELAVSKDEGEADQVPAPPAAIEATSPTPIAAFVRKWSSWSPTRRRGRGATQPKPAEASETDPPAGSFFCVYSESPNESPERAPVDPANLDYANLDSPEPIGSPPTDDAARAEPAAGDHEQQVQQVTLKTVRSQGDLSVVTCTSSDSESPGGGCLLS